MNCYKVKYSKTAEKFLKKNKVQGIKFFKAFEEISQNKENIRLYDIKKFKTQKFDDVFRLRIGEYRAVFRVIDKELLVFVFEIGSRGDIYKNLTALKFS